MSVGSGRKDPNHKTSSSLHKAKNTTATTVFAATGAMTNLVVSTASSSSLSASVPSSTEPAGIVREKNGSGPNDGTQKKNKEKAATSPSPRNPLPPR